MGTTSTQILAAAYTRKRVIFHPPAANRVTIDETSPAVLDGGPTLQQGQAPLEYSEEKHAGLQTHPFHAVASAAGTVLGITEIFGEWEALVAAGQSPILSKPIIPSYPESPYAGRGGYRQGG